MERKEYDEYGGRRRTEISSGKNPPEENPAEDRIPGMVYDLAAQVIRFISEADELYARSEESAQESRKEPLEAEKPPGGLQKYLDASC